MCLCVCVRACEKRARESKHVPLREHLDEGKSYLYITWNVFCFICLSLERSWEPWLSEEHRLHRMDSGEPEAPSLRTGKRQEPTSPVVAHRGSPGLLRDTEVTV